MDKQSPGAEGRELAEFVFNGQRFGEGHGGLLPLG